MRTTKIIITGGHITPAEAVIDEIRKLHLPWEIVIIGRSKAVEGGSGYDREREIAASKGVRFLSITTGRIQRSLTWFTVISLIKIPIGFVQSLVICLREKPDIVLTFGSYIAVPVAFSAFICRIPIITHEQTIQPGLANIVISRIARIICVSFPETVRAFSKKKTILTGLPIRKEILEPQKKDFFPTDNPILYITGGSLGSSSMNALLFPLIHDFIKTYTVIHQTGAASYGPASEIRQSLPITLRNRYVIQQYVDTEPAAWVLHKAEAVITRAGANTVIELAYLHKRAILIPLPWAGAGEQEKHARWFCNREIGRIIDQKKAIPSDIIHALTQITGEENRITSSVSPVPADGARRVIDIVSAVLLQPDDKHA